MVKTLSTKTNRIKAFDIIRGLFLIVILIDHIELYPSGWDLFTGRGRLLVSAAKGFFFMSGLLVGLVYRRRLAQGLRVIFKKMLKRAGQLYLASVFFTLFYTAAALYLKHPNIKDGLSDTVNWIHTAKETLLMRYGYGWADFLDRFAILMFMAPAAFYLLAKRKWWLLIAASLTAWALRGSNFTLAWQFIFFLGMAVGFYWNELKNKWALLATKQKKRIRAGVLTLTVISFALSWVSVYVLSLLNQKMPTLSAGWQAFIFHWNSVNTWVWTYSQKWTMGPLRVVLFMLWFSALFMIVKRYENRINQLSRGLIELLGQNSLFVYIAHSMIVFNFKLFIPLHTNLAANFIITTAALATLLVVTMAYKRYEFKIRLGLKSMVQFLPRRLWPKAEAL